MGPIKESEMSLKDLIPGQLCDLFDYLYAVGGCVRDALLGIEHDDVDLTGPYDSEYIVERCEALGISAHVMSNPYKTVAITIDDQLYEYTQFRTEFNQDGRQTEWKPAGTLEEDLKRRDFPINAMAVDIWGELVDYHDGRGDLKRRLIRTVGDPVECFNHDVLRMIRMCRFAAKFNFDICPYTRRAARKYGLAQYMDEALYQDNPDRILKVERVVSEFKKAFRSPNPDVFLRLMMEIGAFDGESHWGVFREMDELDQDPRWHGDNVWGHTRRVVRDVQPVERFDIADLRMAALLHDIGKTLEHQAVLNPYGGTLWFSFKGHENVDPMFFIEKLNLSNDLIDLIRTVALNHMRVKNMVKPSKIRQFQRDMLRPDGRDLLPAVEAVCRADAGVKPFNALPFEPIEEPLQPVLMGRHLIAAGVEPGEEMGRMLKKAEVYQFSFNCTDVDTLLKVAMS
jgi:tRNA nucleotidyltransferase (CCA-adding enzyme)